MVATVPLQLTDAALAADVGAGLAQVEATLAEAAQAQEPLLTSASRHLIDAGGKRFRATLTLVAAQFGDPHDPRVVPGATAIELTHLATLYHDDVMDDAAIRRGQESANKRWTNTVAILTGDFLFARASEIMAELGAEAIRIQSQTFARLVNGQIAETLGPREGEDPLAHYLRVVDEKTACLIATAGRFGALLSGAPEPVVARVAGACHHLGVAFQLSDDILDVASESHQSGKTPGTDLREGIRSLPVLHALRSVSAADARLRELLDGADLTGDAALEEALRLLRAHPAMDAARADLRYWVELAKEEVAGLPAGAAREAFERMCTFVIERTG